MADSDAWFPDVQGFLPHMSRATLALGIAVCLADFSVFVFCLFVLLLLLLGAGKGEARGFKIQQGIVKRARGWWGWKVFDCQPKGPKEMETS